MNNTSSWNAHEAFILNTTKPAVFPKFKALFYLQRCKIKNFISSTVVSSAWNLASTCSLIDG
jgi:hypothetical protein